MRWSRFYLYTTREEPRDAEVVSHRLMSRAGMIKKVAAGIYSYLPLGWRSVMKLMTIVRRELDKAGAVELSMPAIQPAELWRESGRWQDYGKELLRIEDRHNRDFVFGPTHEEVITDIVRRDVRSYRHLPLNLYQIQTKFRDEVRPRFGLMRGREFIMKDAYSFHTDAESLDESYQAMHDAYCRIFEACELEYIVVEADTGSIGGSSSHEFMVLADTGESTVVRCRECGYAANVELAAMGKMPPHEVPAELSELQAVDTPEMTTIEDVAGFLGVPTRQIVKTLIYSTENGPVAVVVRGDREVNALKLARVLGSPDVEMAGDELVASATGAPVGFAGPVGLPDGVRVVADEMVRGLHDFVCGANATDKHYTGVNWGRDAEPAEWADITVVGGEDPCPKCDGLFEQFRGIEVGHIFKLGTKYSRSMGCNYLDDQGKSHPAMMGCYGLGIGRTVAAAIEQNHDDGGISWPRPLAPFEVTLLSLNPKDEAVSSVADGLYDSLTEAGVEVFYDDRKERPGVKFNDADLVGIPIRIVVGAKSLAEGNVEVSLRSDREKRLVPAEDAVGLVGELTAG